MLQVLEFLDVMTARILASRDRPLKTRLNKESRGVSCVGILMDIQARGFLLDES